MVFVVFVVFYGPTQHEFLHAWPRVIDAPLPTCLTVGLKPVRWWPNHSAVQLAPFISTSITNDIIIRPRFNEPAIKP